MTTHKRTVARPLAVALAVLTWTGLAFCGEIHDAAGDGDLEKVKVLLKDHPNLVSSRDTNGTTPLYGAAQWGHRDVVQLLLASKAEVDAKNLIGFTPLHAAAAAGHKDVAELLLASKAEVNAKAGDGATPLHAAALEGHRDVVELLLTNKAEVNARDGEGETALHLAAARATSRWPSCCWLTTPKSMPRPKAG